MPLPRIIARLNKRYTNRFIEPVVSRFAGFAIVTHQGRHSGNTYRTPIFVFEADGQNTLVAALTYGPSADWVQNVQQHGGAIDYCGSTRTIDAASVVRRPEAGAQLPTAVEIWLRLLRVTDFMRLDVSPYRPTTKG